MAKCRADREAVMSFFTIPMNINIKATNMDLTPAIKEYLEKKLESVEKKLIDPNDTSTQADVEVGKTTKHHKKGDVFRAEFNVHIGGNFFRSESVQENLYAAIDEAQSELFRAIRSQKTKKKDVTRRGMLRVKNALKGLRW